MQVRNAIGALKAEPRLRDRLVDASSGLGERSGLGETSRRSTDSGIGPRLVRSNSGWSDSGAGDAPPTARASAPVRGARMLWRMMRGGKGAGGAPVAPAAHADLVRSSSRESRSGRFSAAALSSADDPQAGRASRRESSSPVSREDSSRRRRGGSRERQGRADGVSSALPFPQKSYKGGAPGAPCRSPFNDNSSRYSPESSRRSGEPGGSNDSSRRGDQAPRAAPRPLPGSGLPRQGSALGGLAPLSRGASARGLAPSLSRGASAKGLPPPLPSRQPSLKNTIGASLGARPPAPLLSQFADGGSGRLDLSNGAPNGAPNVAASSKPPVRAAPMLPPVRPPGIMPPATMGFAMQVEQGPSPAYRAACSG